MKHILFLGNSFTFFNDLPAMLAGLCTADGIEVHTDSVTRGGAYLHQFTEEGDELFALLKEKIAAQHWDYVVLQDQSSNPARCPDDTAAAAGKIAAMFDQDTRFLLYQTWSYRDGTEKLQSVHMTYEGMRTALREGYRNAAKAIGGVCVPVGDAFAPATQKGIDVYKPDDFHPSAQGTYIAACLFMHAVFGTIPQTHPAEISAEHAEILRGCAKEVL